MPDTDRRTGSAGAGATVHPDRSQRLLDQPRFRRAQGRGPRLADEITAVVLDTGELACRHRRVFAGGLTLVDPAHQTQLERPAP
jgi:hypothetical protein